MKPLGHDLDLDNPDDVDWLVEWGKEAEKVIKELEAEVAEYRGLIDGDVDAAWRELRARAEKAEKKLNTSYRIAEDYKEKWHRAIDMWEKAHNELVDAREKIVRLEERLAIREKGTL